MTNCCRTLIQHAFDVWKLNRVTIECATENARSRAIPERLGFKLEGIVRGIEWLQDRYVDHAMYGLLNPNPDGEANVPEKHLQLPGKVTGFGRLLDSLVLPEHGRSSVERSSVMI